MADTAVALSQTADFGFRLQADEVTPATLVASDFARLFAGDNIPMPSIELGNFDTPKTGNALDRAPGRRTTRQINQTWSEQIMLTSPATEPIFSAPLQACGYQVETCRRIPVGAITGEFRPGEDITSGAKTAVFVSRETSGATVYLVYVIIEGGEFAASDAIVGAVSGATTTVELAAAPDDCGFLFRTLSESTGVVPPSGTMEYFKNGSIYRGVGARGNAQIVLAPNEPGRIEFEMKAPWALAAGDAIPQGSPPAGIVLPPNVAPQARGANMIIDPDGDAFVIPVAAAMTLNTANEGDPRPTLTGDVAGSGFAPARIVDRAAVIGLQVDLTDASSHDFFGVAARADSIGQEWAYGDWEDTGGSVHFHAAATQYQAPTGTDRNKIQGLDITADIRRATRNDWAYWVAVLKTP